VKIGKLYRLYDNITIGARKLPILVSIGKIYYIKPSTVFMYLGVTDFGHRFLWQDNILYVIGKLEDYCREVGKQQ